MMKPRSLSSRLTAAALAGALLTTMAFSGCHTPPPPTAPATHTTTDRSKQGPMVTEPAPITHPGG